MRARWIVAALLTLPVFIWQMRLCAAWPGFGATLVLLSFDLGFVFMAVDDVFCWLTKPPPPTSPVRVYKRDPDGGWQAHLADGSTLPAFQSAESKPAPLYDPDLGYPPR